MTVLIDNYEELTDVVGWVYLTNKWSIGQARIVIHNVRNIHYTRLLSGNVHLRFPIIVDMNNERIILYYAPSTPIHADLSYNDWEDLFK